SRTIFQIKLSSSLPGTITGPDSLPSKAPPRLLRFRPASRRLRPWQAVQCAWRIGSTSVSNPAAQLAGAAAGFCRLSAAGGTAIAVETTHVSVTLRHTIRPRPGDLSARETGVLAMIATP